GVDAWWYGAAATGVTVREQGRWRDALLEHHVRDADVGRTGVVLAATGEGVYEGGRRLDLPRRAPGNALDGALAHEGKLLVYGPRGLFRMEPEPVPWLEEPVRDAGPYGAGVAALTADALWAWPGPARSPVDPEGAWCFALAPGDRVELAGATELR